MFVNFRLFALSIFEVDEDFWCNQASSRCGASGGEGGGKKTREYRKVERDKKKRAKVTEIKPGDKGGVFRRTPNQGPERRHS